MGSEDLDERRTRILRHVVDEYIRTGSPVGSGSLAGRRGLGVSSATIRNEMAVLEEMGYLTQPHTSAGRIPTDLGYRHFVDSLVRLPKLSQTRRGIITATIDAQVSDLEEMMRRTAQVLSRMTRYAAVALPPATTERPGIARVDLVPISSGALLLVVHESGRVDKRTIDLPEADGAAERLSPTLAESFGGLSLPHAEALARRMAAQAPPADREVLTAVADALGELGSEPAEEHVFVGGVANIAGEDAFEHRDTLRRIYQALDEETSILSLMRRLTAGDEDLAVSIGSENPLAAMQEASVVVARYRIGEHGEGTVAVIGPTRMAYPSAMSTVEAVARRLAAAIDEIGG